MCCVLFFPVMNHTTRSMLPKFWVIMRSATWISYNSPQIGATFHSRESSGGFNQWRSANQDQCTDKKMMKVLQKSMTGRLFFQIFSFHRHVTCSENSVLSV